MCSEPFGVCRLFHNGWPCFLCCAVSCLHCISHDCCTFPAVHANRCHRLFGCAVFATLACSRPVYVSDLVTGLVCNCSTVSFVTFLSSGSPRREDHVAFVLVMLWPMSTLRTLAASLTCLATPTLARCVFVSSFLNTVTLTFSGAILARLSAAPNGAGCVQQLPVHCALLEWSGALDHV